MKALSTQMLSFLITLSYFIGIVFSADSSGHGRSRRHQAGSSRRAARTSLPAEVPQIEPPVQWDVYNPASRTADGQLCELEFGPQFDTSRMILDPIQDSREEYLIREILRDRLYRQGAYPGDRDFDSRNELAKSRALQHLKRIDRPGGGCLWSSAHRRLYINKLKDPAIAVYEYDHNQVPTLRESKRNGVIEFLKPGEPSQNHLAHENGMHSDSDKADSFYHTSDDSNSAADHFNDVNDADHYFDDDNIDSDAGS